MDAYIGEMRLLPYTFPPENWLPCDGRQMQITYYQALYAVIGGTYGGDGRTYFQLPDMRGRTAMGMGAGPGLTPRTIGQPVGAYGETVTLTAITLPAHIHTLNGAFQNGSASLLTAKTAPDDYFTYPQYTAGTTGYYSTSFASTAIPTVTLSPLAIALAGGGQPHPNMQPYLAMQWCICCEGGEFPMRP